MISASLMLIVLIAVMAVLDEVTAQSSRDSERGLAVREAQGGLHRMVTELRQAYLINGCGTKADVTQCTRSDYAHSIDFNVRTRTNQRRRVIYNCVSAWSGTSNNPNAATQYRRCMRLASAVETDPTATCCVRPTAVTDQLVNRVTNWCRPDVASDPFVCPSPAPKTPAPVFNYRRTDLSGAYTDLTSPSPTAVRSQITGADPRLATQIEIVVEMPSAGERKQSYAASAPNVLLQDAAWLRNIDL